MDIESCRVRISVLLRSSLMDREKNKWTYVMMVPQRSTSACPYHTTICMSIADVSQLIDGPGP